MIFYLDLKSLSRYNPINFVIDFLHLWYFCFVVTVWFVKKEHLTPLFVSRLIASIVFLNFLYRGFRFDPYYIISKKYERVMQQQK